MSLLALLFTIAAGPACAQDFGDGPRQFDGVNSMGPYAWLPSRQAPTILAENLVKGGWEGGRELYVCRARFEDSWYPGKYFAGVCDFAAGGEAMSFGGGFQILAYTGISDRAALFPRRWVAPTTIDGFIGGAVSIRMRVCQAEYAVDDVPQGTYPGNEWGGKCVIAVEGREVAVEPYRILVLLNGTKK